MVYDKRITRLQEILEARGLAGAILLYSRDVFYYTGTAQPSLNKYKMAIREKMNHLDKWAMGRNLGLVIIGWQPAVSAESLYKWMKSVKNEELWNDNNIKNLRKWNGEVLGGPFFSLGMKLGIIAVLV